MEAARLFACAAPSHEQFYSDRDLEEFAAIALLEEASNKINNSQRRGAGTAILQCGTVSRDLDRSFGFKLTERKLSSGMPMLRGIHIYGEVMLVLRKPPENSSPAPHQALLVQFPHYWILIDPTHLQYDMPKDRHWLLGSKLLADAEYGPKLGVFVHWVAYGNTREDVIALWREFIYNKEYVAGVYPSERIGIGDKSIVPD